VPSLTIHLYQLRWVIAFTLAVVVILLAAVEPSYARTMGYYWRP
jgi:hypothetical protein